MKRLVVINAVGLTPRLLAHAPRLSAVGTVTPLVDELPSVTCTAQASMLTGQTPRAHGIVANGWLFRDTMEVRFWQQSNRLIQADPVYVTARKRAALRGETFTAAKLFWWFNQGAAVDISVTPKPHYGIDGGKVFGITGTPAGRCEKLERTLGAFPFHTFWGPMAGLPCTQWIARAAADVLKNDRPNLTFVYLPHLDYDPQRFGPAGCEMPRLVKQLDDACAPLLDAAKETDTAVMVVSEYGHCDVDTPVYVNRVLRSAGLLVARSGPFGEMLDVYASRAFAVCDHQLAHVYVNDPADIPRVRDLLTAVPGVATVLAGDARAGLDHPRSGELVLLSDRRAWFAYPFWTDDALAPDYARCVAIHHKPGYDPAELFLDPALRVPKLKIGQKLIAKKLGFRMKMDVIPLDAKIVRGSHGLRAETVDDGPLWIRPGAGTGPMPMTAVRDGILEMLGLAD